ncbi:hypothetical protein JXD38_06635 [candidate division WOR-3 bacterium]|nr:hypothetical protein [candidate division WOR-3 bacterium]
MRELGEYLANRPAARPRRLLYDFTFDEEQREQWSDPYTQLLGEQEVRDADLADMDDKPFSVKSYLRAP